MPVGAIIPFAGSTVPEGWLLCDGSAVSRSEYSELFDVIGTTYGAGDGSTTFALPSLTGRAALGASSGYSIGSVGGSETVTVDATEMPDHYHVVPEHGHDDTIAMKTPSLSHSITQPVMKYKRLDGAIANGGSGSQVTRYNSTSSKSMSRSTSVGVADHPATACTMSGGVTDCAALTSGATGGGGAHNNMMPFIALNYIIYAGA
jgi:microcystin-dependent protein